MIKRSFFSLTQPRLNYCLIESDPKEPQSIPVPSSLKLLLNEPIDSTKGALIKKGDAVEKGQKLALYDDSTDYAISPVSGTIGLIETYSDDFGNKAASLVINSSQNPSSDATPLSYDIKDDIAGADQYFRHLPGAPPLKVLADPDTKISALVITCADKDLLSTTQQFVALKNSTAFKEGIRVLKQISGISRICATVPEGLDLGDDLGTVQILKTSPVYPANLPAMILKDHFNMILPPGLTPQDLGFCFISAEAVVSLAKAFESKSALFEKIVTVLDKNGEQRRVKATIGTPVKQIFDACNIRIQDQDRVVIGGPMTGFATFSVNHPVVPDMDMIIVQGKENIPEVSDNACVNCGKCIQICPAQVPVNLLVRFLEVNQVEEAADQYDLESCIDCGLCAYVCTARIPIFQYIRLGKYELMKLKADAIAAEAEETAEADDMEADTAQADDIEMETANE
jgi:electron transport complex protein RnfC